jgi:hypothetical protein
MTTTPLSAETRIKLRLLFAPGEALAVEELLESRCGAGLPLVESQGLEGIERIRCGVLKMSNGSMTKLLAEVDTANMDWRDVLMSAGFAHDVQAHRFWLENEKES